MIISIIMRRCILIIMVRIIVIIRIFKTISTNRILIRTMVPGKKSLQSINKDINISSEKSTEEDGRKSNCSPREISEESNYKFNTESGFEVEEEV